MLENSLWLTDPTSLMNAFRDALRALIPVAEKIHMRWKEPNNYDDWDAICSAIFCSIVVRSIESATEDKDFFPIVSYDKRISSYDDKSYISDACELGAMAFVCLQTDVRPFDTCLFANLDRDGNVYGHCSLKFDVVNFVLVGNKTGCSEFVRELEVVL